SATATATLGNNTSEFGPVVKVLAPLAVNLLSFSSSYSDHSVTLNWKARSDHEFLYFDIEHSTDGKSFSRLATVYPKNVNEINTYDFVNANVTEGNHYYRLKMVNVTGKAGYST